MEVVEHDESKSRKRPRPDTSSLDWLDSSRDLVRDIQLSRHGLGRRVLVFKVEVVPSDKRFAKVTPATWDPVGKGYVPSDYDFLVCRPASMADAEAIKRWFRWCQEPPWQPDLPVRAMILEPGAKLQRNATSSEAPRLQEIAHKQSPVAIAHQMLHDRNRTGRPFFRLAGDPEEMSAVIESAEHTEAPGCPDDAWLGVKIVPESSGVARFSVNRADPPKLKTSARHLRLSTDAYMQATTTFREKLDWLIEEVGEDRVRISDFPGFGAMTAGAQQLVSDELSAPAESRPFVLLVNPLAEHDDRVRGALNGVQSRVANGEQLMYEYLSLFNMPHFDASHENHKGYLRAVQLDQFETYTEQFESQLSQLRQEQPYVHVVFFAAQCYHALSGLLALGVVCNELKGEEKQRCALKVSVLVDSGDWLGGGVGGVYPGRPWIDAYQDTSVARRVGEQVAQSETNDPHCRRRLLFRLKAGISGAENLAFRYHVRHFTSVHSFRNQRREEYDRLVDPARYANLEERPPLILCDSYGTKLAGDPLHPADRRLTSKTPGATLLECASPCTAVFAVGSLPSDTVLILNLTNKSEYTQHDLLRRVLYAVFSRMLPTAKLTLICGVPLDELPFLLRDTDPWDAQRSSLEFIN